MSDRSAFRAVAEATDARSYAVGIRGLTARFVRRCGWSPQQYERWLARQLEAAVAG